MSDTTFGNTVPNANRVNPLKNYLAGIPRWVIVIAAAYMIMLETAEKAPLVATAFQRYKGTIAEAQTKQLEPELKRIQIETAKLQLQAAEYEPRIKSANADRAEFDAQNAKIQPILTAANLVKASNEAKASSLTPAQASANLNKTRSEALAAAVTPDMNRQQLAQLTIDAKTKAHQQGQAACEAINAETGTALNQAVLGLAMPYLPKVLETLKENGIDLPMDKIVGALSTINPAARTNELRGAMLDNASKPLRQRK